MAFKVLGKALAVLTLAAAFVFLGMWQLDRANELQESKKIIPDSTIYQLADLATPATSLDSRNVGKKIQLRGNYILTFRAPNQTDLAELFLAQPITHESNDDDCNADQDPTR